MFETLVSPSAVAVSAEVEALSLGPFLLGEVAARIAGWSSRPSSVNFLVTHALMLFAMGAKEVALFQKVRQLFLFTNCCKLRVTAF